MPELNDAIREAIRATTAKLGSMNPCDRDSVVVIGAELEETAGRVPRELSGLKDLLFLCLQCLQRVYEEGGQGSAGTVAAVSSALCLAESLSFDQPDCEARLRQARDQLGAELAPAGQPGGESAGPESGAPTLDAIAASLVQLEVGDAEGLGRIGRALAGLRDSLACEVHGAIDQAIEIAAKGCEAGSTDAAAATRVGELLEQAMRTIDRAQSGKQAGVARAQAGSQETTAGGGQAAASTGCEEPQIDLDPGLMGEFVTESSEYVQGAEACLLALEANPDDIEAVRTVFRAFHTIKGTSAFLGFNLVSEFAHRAENLLSRIRDGEIRFGGGYADLALRSIDMLKELLKSVEAYAPGAALKKPEAYDELLTVLADPEAAGYSSAGSGEASAAAGSAGATPVQAAAQAGAAGVAPPTAAPAKAAAPQDGATQARAAAETVESVRVSTERLDRLIDMVGELVIANSMVVQDENVVGGASEDLTRKVGHMAKIVRELQDHSMSMRMIPLKGTFQKMARVVRDVARKSGKSVRFVSDGGETEMDRNMVDVINDPLVHMLRNSVDHGIEPPEDREAKGKPREGTVSISAYHSGGSVVIEIADDGRGINREGVMRKAIERGLIREDQVLTDSEVFALIFEPGFSTAQKVTSVSGRGVGLDVVKRGIDALRGRIEVRSEPGKGCTFLLRLPLTMAIIDGMVVRVGGERYIIPALSVVRSVCPELASISTVLEGGELFSLDGDLLPLVRLGNVFAADSAQTDPTQAIILVIEGEGRRAALLVDELLGKQQIVIKSLGKAFGQIRGISGGAIMPDGRVGLIIDVSGLLALAESSGVKEAVGV